MCTFNALGTDIILKLTIWGADYMCIQTMLEIYRISLCLQRCAGYDVDEIFLYKPQNIHRNIKQNSS